MAPTSGDASPRAPGVRSNGTWAATLQSGVASTRQEPWHGSAEGVILRLSREVHLAWMLNLRSRSPTLGHGSGSPMTTGALPTNRPAVPVTSARGPGAPLRIVCPTYWYPQHATDTQATYVHDINRHLVRRGHSVTVVTPGDRSLPSAETLRRGGGRPVSDGAPGRPHLRPGRTEPGERARTSSRGSRS